MALPVKAADLCRRSSEKRHNVRMTLGRRRVAEGSPKGRLGQEVDFFLRQNFHYIQGSYMIFHDISTYLIIEYTRVAQVSSPTLCILSLVNARRKSGSETVAKPCPSEEWLRWMEEHPVPALHHATEAISHQPSSADISRQRRRG